MKKVVFLFAMVFAVSMAMGQDNVTTIDQIGDDHQATINQGGELNRAFVEQTTPDYTWSGIDYGVATITQQGTENLANLKQSNFYGNSVANITQVGNQNRVVGYNGGAFFQNSQSLETNRLDVMMEGNGNVLYATRSEAQKNGNTFLLDVDGSSNRIGMEQEFGWADLDITGSSNRVTLYQHGVQGTGTWERADIDILGDSNVANVWQNNGGNRATVNVNGSFNNASVTQTGGVILP